MSGELTSLDLELIEAEGKLAAKQLRFARAYMGEAKYQRTEAARIAGYSQPDTEGSRQMSNSKVRRYIALVARVQQRDTSLFTARAVQEVGAIAFSNITDILDVTNKGTLELRASRLHELPYHVRAAIKKLEVDHDASGQPRVRVELHDKMRALQMLIDAGIEPDAGTGRTENLDGITYVLPPGVEPLPIPDKEDR